MDRWVNMVMQGVFSARMHGRGWEGGAPESDAARRGTRRPTRLTASPAASEFFFFSRIRAESAGFAPTRLDSRRIGPISARIGPYRPYRVVSAGDRYGRYGRNRPKSALKIAGEAEILTSDAFLALFFLCFVNQVY